MSSRFASAAIACGFLALAACGRAKTPATASADTAAAATTDSSVRAAASPDTVPPSGVVDSALPMDVLLERFRRGTRQVTSLTGGARSRDALVAAWAKAMASRDVAAFDRLLMTRDEFAWLYYPTNPQALPPYELSPALLWFQLEGASRKGLGRALDERGGEAFRFAGYSCDSVPSKQGENTVWGPCEVLRVQAAGDTVRERLFALLIERGGVWKFVSYGNKL